MYQRLSNQQCYSNNKNMYKQCNVLKDGRVIPSCSNTYGIDSIPASVPQQSNFHFLDGIYGVKTMNSFTTAGRYYKITLPTSVINPSVTNTYLVGSEVPYIDGTSVKMMKLEKDGTLSYLKTTKITIDGNVVFRKLIQKIIPNPPPELIIKSTDNCKNPCN